MITSLEMDDTASSYSENVGARIIVLLGLIPLTKLYITSAAPFPKIIFSFETISLLILLFSYSLIASFNSK